MAKIKELPELVGEFVDLAKQYVKDQTIGAAKRLGRLAGMGFAAAILFLLGALFLAVAGTRAIVGLMPDGPGGPDHALWSGLGYVVAAIALLGVTGLVMWRATK